MTLIVTKAQAARLAKNSGADLPPPPPPVRPRRVSNDDLLCRAGWMPRYVHGRGFDYWQACGSGESAGVCDSYMAARALALARIAKENAAPVE